MIQLTYYLSIAFILPLCFGQDPAFRPLFADLNFHKLQLLELESESHIHHNADHLKITHANGTITVHPIDKQTTETLISSLEERYDGSKQWLAWYYKSNLLNQDGFTSFNATWQVPAMPQTSQTNLATFNGLQAAPDPQPWNWILQPVVVIGDWMWGSSSTWVMSSVVCMVSSCLWTPPYETKPGHVIQGTITLVQQGPPYNYSIQIVDLTANSPVQTLYYASQYFAPWAYVSLEHNPEGPIESCQQLPGGGNGNITYQVNALDPTSADFWGGAQNDMSCGLSVENFIYTDGELPITL